QLATLGPDNLICAASRAMLLPPEQRGGALSAVAHVAGEGQAFTGALLEDVAWAYGVDERGWGMSVYDVPGLLLGRDRGGELAWLAPLALAVRPPDAKDRDLLLVGTAA